MIRVFSTVWEEILTIAKTSLVKDLIRGKNIVITGANSGIGFAVLGLLAPNNRVLAVDKRGDRIRALGSDNVTYLELDASTEEGVDKIFEEGERLFPKIDIFHANAGFGYFERINYVDAKRVEDIFATNVFSPIYSYQKMLKHLAGRQGTFAISVSGIGKLPVPGYALYSATKAALNAFEECLRAELPANVKLTCLYPVTVYTPFYATAVDGINVENLEPPSPKQNVDIVARKMVRGIARGAKRVYPYPLFQLMNAVAAICPPAKLLYQKLQYKKLLRYEDTLT